MVGALGPGRKGQLSGSVTELTVLGLGAEATAPPYQLCLPHPAAGYGCLRDPQPSWDRSQKREQEPTSALRPVLMSVSGGPDVCGSFQTTCPRWPS